eukprot:GHVN01068850.1.p1 GENE.GHVN01068850.1~~GHVN01068850.1.p1  ORF type:complete len:104 (-),score=23.25 GHVN01068850.1:5-316(-)
MQLSWEREASTTPLTVTEDQEVSSMVSEVVQMDHQARLAHLERPPSPPHLIHPTRSSRMQPHSNNLSVYHIHKDGWTKSVDQKDVTELHFEYAAAKGQTGEFM